MNDDRDNPDAPLYLKHLGTVICAGILALIIILATGPMPERAGATTEIHPRAAAGLPNHHRPAAAHTHPGHVTTSYREWVIRQVFGPRHGAAAVRVARCESGIRPWARNGQYRGILQMGSAERARYGHGAGAWAQARAALRYFIASGSDWSPWECRWAA